MKVNKYISTKVDLETDVDVEIDSDDVVNFIEDGRTTNSELVDIRDALTETMEERGINKKSTFEIMPSDVPGDATLYDELKMDHLRDAASKYSLEEIERRLPLQHFRYQNHFRNNAAKLKYKCKAPDCSNETDNKGDFCSSCYYKDNLF